MIPRLRPGSLRNVPGCPSWVGGWTSVVSLEQTFASRPLSSERAAEAWRNLGEGMDDWKVGRVRP
jgi:hypothetical protein